MTAHFAHPHPEPTWDKLDDAIDRGFDPHPDDMLPPAAHLVAGEGVDVLAVFAAEVEAARERWAS